MLAYQLYLILYANEVTSSLLRLSQSINNTQMLVGGDIFVISTPFGSMYPKVYNLIFKFQLCLYCAVYPTNILVTSL